MTITTFIQVENLRTRTNSFSYAPEECLLSFSRKDGGVSRYIRLSPLRVANGIFSQGKNVEVLNVEYVRNADVQDDAFENLVLDLEIKSTLESLCRSYTKSRKPSKPITTDFVKGKGEGQIFLLHGPPGVGKTCTAGMLFSFCLQLFQAYLNIRDLPVAITDTK